MPNAIHPSALFAQLQQRYPNASLITELVQIHQGSFVVRALIQLGGMPLVSSLAAAGTVEQAEAEAQQRALQLVGISTVTPAVAAPPPLQAQLLTSPLDNGNLLSALPALPTITPSETVSSAPITPLSGSTCAALEPPAVPEVPPFMPSAPPIEIDEEVPPPPPARSNSKKSARSPQSRTPPSEPEPEMDEPTDLSELIALSDVEMQRVGWKRKDGQVHLLETYGVKTRAELNEEQLLEFLHFLRAVPSDYSVM